MSNHERFEELCAMAAAGEISAGERQELMTHLEGCAFCEKSLADMTEIHSAWLPERDGFEIKRGFAAESKLRQAILERLMLAGGQFSEEALSPTPPTGHRAGFWHQRVSSRTLAVTAVVLLAVASAGFLGWLNSHSLMSPHARSQDVGVAKAPTPTAGADAMQIEALRQSLWQSRDTQNKLEEGLKRAQAERQALEARLAEAEQGANVAQQSNAAAIEEIAELRAQIEAARGNETKAQTQLAALKSSYSQSEGELNLTRSENADLRSKLSQQVGSLDRERELMADGREIRDLIAARNLHIIDVYDTSGEGKTQKSFGRVFYTEGKSLIFYAYDLPDRRPMTKYAYYAWGKRDVSGDVKVRNLGIFYNDDQAQRRWVLRITDPVVLSEIDSVFVTLEKSDDRGKSPTGKKLLSAYLGSPANHP